jgi:NADH:ubiquinone oxidoreductase subunit 5 (subunit L)/multisubunit Na+/H+ antiporter MnhA subunit
MKMPEKSGKAALIVFAFAILGLIIAMILQVLYDEQLLIHQAITQSSQLPALQIVVVLLCIMIGIVLAAITS